MIRRTCIGALIAAASVGLTAFNADADYTNVVLADTPVAFYPLDLTVDVNGTATDATGHGNDSTYYNIYPASGPSAYIPNAATFSPSVDSYVDLATGGSPGLLQFTGPTTLEAWVQPADSTSFGDIIAKGYDGSTYQEIVLRVNGAGNGNDYFGTFGTAGVSGGQQNTDWAHVVMANDGSSTSLYVNGVLVQRNGDSTGSINYAATWAIGDGTSAGDTRFFNGNICQVAIYNYGLSQGQVLQHFYYGKLNTSTNAAPIITSQPQPQATFAGGSATFSFAATSAFATTNQWLFNGNPISGQTAATLQLNNVQSTNAGTYSVVIGNGHGTTNSAGAALTLYTPAQLEWSASGNSGAWDTASSANWLNLVNSQTTVFNLGDSVLFDDKVGEPTTVSVNGSVAPSLVTVNSSTNSFTINGGGTLTGPATFVKTGSSYLTVTCSGNFTGPARIGGGTLYAGNNSFDSASSITISNGATLDMGGGTFNGAKPVFVSGAGVGGQGALINTYADYPGESLAVTLTGDAVVGGSARWDLANGSSISGPHNLVNDFSADTSNPYAEWNSPTVGSDVVDITFTNGSKLGAKNCDSTFQNPATMTTISPNGQLIFWSGGWNGSIHLYGTATAYLWTAPAAFNGSTIVMEESAQWQSWNPGGDEPINSAVVLNGVAHFVLGDHNMLYSNVISGPGGFLMDYWNHAVVLSAANTYTGPTIIGSGGNSPVVSLSGNGSISHSSLIFFGGGDPTVTHIDVSGRSDQTLTLASGQTLGGIGAINGSLVVSPGATLAPAGSNTTIGVTVGANAEGAIAAANNVTLQGTTIIKVDASGTNDLVTAGGTMQYGGALQVVNVGATAFTVGQSFTVFKAASFNGAFATPPAGPGPGLTWDLSQLASGKIIVASKPTLTATLVNGSLNLTGANGADNATFYILTSTNAAAPLSQWKPVSTNSYNGSGTFNLSLPLTNAAPQNFYIIKM